MMLSRPKCPVVAREQAWVESSMAWFRGEFGDGWLGQPVIEPTADFFPGVYLGTDDDIRALVGQVAGHVGVEFGRLIVELRGDTGEKDLVHATGLAYESKGPAGHYRRAGDKFVIVIDRTLATRPTQLVAVVAHELGHVLLLGDKRIDHDRADHEPLTDLLTVYLGLGIFSANARMQAYQDHYSREVLQLGYLTEPMFGYGLACFTWLRRENKPPWAKHLATNPRDTLRRGVRYLRSAAQPMCLPTVMPSQAG